MSAAVRPAGILRGHRVDLQLISGTNVIAYVPKGAGARPDRDRRRERGGEQHHQHADPDRVGRHQLVCVELGHRSNGLHSEQQRRLRAEGHRLDPSVSTNPLTDGGTGPSPSPAGRRRRPAWPWTRWTTRPCWPSASAGPAGSSSSTCPPTRSSLRSPHRDPGGEISEDPLMDPVHNIIGSASEDNNFESSTSRTAPRRSSTSRTCRPQVHGRA